MLPPRHPAAGQASAEYVALLLVATLVLAGTAAVAVPGVGERLVRTVRTGICIVGGDVCRERGCARRRAAAVRHA